jgi:hypothetical protein
VVEIKASKRVKSATETAERALKQAQQKETQALERESKQRDVTRIVASRLDSAIARIEQMVAGR